MRATAPVTENIRYEITHTSHYRYATHAQQCVMMLCLKPRANQRQKLLHFDIKTQPSAYLSCETDYFGNTRHVLDVHQAHDALEITTFSTVEVAPVPLPSKVSVGSWKKIRSPDISFTNWDYTHPSTLARPSPALAAFVDRHRIRPGHDSLEDLLQLSDTLYRNLHYAPGSTTAESSIEHILENGGGVCQDYAHLMIAIVRSWGIPARYVSGYLHVTGQPGEQVPDNATHAWVECQLPKLGWTGFDPTNRSLADQRHVRVAVGRDYRDISPTRGVLQGGGEIQLDVDVQVRASTDEVANNTTAEKP